jgi:hypothetical protein
MNYQVIKDEQVLRDFIDWLPELQPNEKYYFCLFARNKYCKELSHIKSDKAQLKRFVTDKERMFQKIKQLEIEEGWYRQRDFPVPDAALALYMTVNPRNMMKATVNTMVKLAQSIRDQNIDMNCHAEAMSEIQKAKSRTVWVDFDFDNKLAPMGLEGRYKDYGEYLADVVPNFIGEGQHMILETRGGFHLLVNPDTVSSYAKNSWYQALQKLGHCDQVGDNMIPVPGCNQGLFTPHFINTKTCAPTPILLLTSPQKNELTEEPRDLSTVLKEQLRKS